MSRGDSRRGTLDARRLWVCHATSSYGPCHAGLGAKPPRPLLDEAASQPSLVVPSILPCRDQGQNAKPCPMPDAAFAHVPSSRPKAPISRINGTLPVRDRVTSHGSAWSAGFRPLRVLHRTEPLLRPAPPKGREARRVEWRMNLPIGTDWIRQSALIMGRWKVPRGAAGRPDGVES